MQDSSVAASIGGARDKKRRIAVGRTDSFWACGEKNMPARFFGLRSVIVALHVVLGEFKKSFMSSRAP